MNNVLIQIRTYFIISLILLLLPGVVFCQFDQNIKFERLSVEDGLASSNITDIIEDHMGFIWISTKGGLHRYDGYNFTIYQPEVNNPNSLSNTFCIGLCEDLYGDIWIGTYGGGLNRFERESEKFYRYVHDPLDSLSLSNNHITRICASPVDSNTIWIATHYGCNKLDIRTGTFTQYHHDPADTNSLSGNWVWTLYYDMNDELWIGSVGGLDKFDPIDQIFKQYVQGGAVKAILEDRSGYFWVGGTRGLLRFEDDKKTYRYFQKIEDDPTSLTQTYILSIAEDPEGNL